MEENIPEGLSVLTFPEAQRKRLRTSNIVERVNKEIKRRMRVACIFPNEASALRLVTAIVRWKYQMIGKAEKDTYLPHKIFWNKF